MSHHTPVSSDRDRRVRTLRELAQEAILRYGRHLVLPDVGPEGQRLLKAARVLLVGPGGLGSPLVLYLAAAWAPTRRAWRLPR